MFLNFTYFLQFFLSVFPPFVFRNSPSFPQRPLLYFLSIATSRSCNQCTFGLLSPRVSFDVKELIASAIHVQTCHCKSSFKSVSSTTVSLACAPKLKSDLYSEILQPRFSKETYFEWVFTGVILKSNIFYSIKNCEFYKSPNSSLMLFRKWVVFKLFTHIFWVIILFFNHN
jgi:hypothetical protein